MFGFAEQSNHLGEKDGRVHLALDERKYKNIYPEISCSKTSDGKWFACQNEKT